MARQDRLTVWKVLNMNFIATLSFLTPSGLKEKEAPRLALINWSKYLDLIKLDAYRRIVYFPSSVQRGLSNSFIALEISGNLQSNIQERKFTFLCHSDITTPYNFFYTIISLYNDRPFL